MEYSCQYNKSKSKCTFTNIKEEFDYSPRNNGNSEQNNKEQNFIK